MNEILHDSFRTYAAIIFLRLLLDMRWELKVILEGAARYRNKFYPLLTRGAPWSTVLRNDFITFWWQCCDWWVKSAKGRMRENYYCVSSICHSYAQLIQSQCKGWCGEVVRGCCAGALTQRRESRDYSLLFSMKEWWVPLPTFVRLWEPLRFGGRLPPIARTLGPGLGGSLAVAHGNSAYHLPPCCPHVMLLSQPVLVLGISCILWGMKSQGRHQPGTRGFSHLVPEHALGPWVVFTKTLF